MSIKFPVAGTVFDYCVHPVTKRFVPWLELCLETKLTKNAFQDILIPTAETLSLSYFAGLLVQLGQPCMFVGPAGCGKSVIARNVLAQLDDTFQVQQFAFNHCTTADGFQQGLEAHLERKIGKNFGPTGNKRLVCFIDDFNMPAKDAFGTQSPHAFLRQHLSFGHWFDRAKFNLKKVSGVQFIACMNPTAGSFGISPRVQRYFTVFALGIPGDESLHTIFSTIFAAHLRGETSEIVVRNYAATGQVEGTYACRE